MFLFELLKALIFGIIEGVTEWLPVSSTGHMLLLDGLLRLNVSDSFYEVFEVLIQLGAACAVAVKYRERLTPFGKSAEGRRATRRLWQATLLGVLPSAVIGLLFDDLIEEKLYTPTVVALMLILYGAAFIIAEALMKKGTPKATDLSHIDNKKAITVGLFQILSLVPGTSRSGVTILGAYLCGASRSLAAEFSFLLALPTMIGAGALRGVKFIAEGNGLRLSELAILAAGTLTAYAVSRIVVDFLTDFVRKHGFLIFGIYRIILGGILLFYFWGRT